MAEITIFNPPGLGRPLGQYSQIARVKAASEFIFIAGQLSTDTDGNIVGDGNFAAQCAQVFANIGTALASVGAGWGNVMQFTTYFVHSQDIPKFMAYRRQEFPRLFPNGAYRAAMVCTSIRKGSPTSRSTISNVLGG